MPNTHHQFPTRLSYLVESHRRCVLNLQLIQRGFGPKWKTEHVERIRVGCRIGILVTTADRWVHTARHIQLHSTRSVFNFYTKSICSRRELVVNSVHNIHMWCVLGFVVNLELVHAVVDFVLQTCSSVSGTAMLYWVKLNASRFLQHTELNIMPQKCHRMDILLNFV